MFSCCYFAIHPKTECSNHYSLVSHCDLSLYTAQGYQHNHAEIKLKTKRGLWN